MAGSARSGRRWVLAGGVLVVALAAYPAWKSARAWAALRDAREALASGDLKVAEAALQRVDALAPNRPDVQFLLARTSRRAGKYDLMERYLGRAERLGWPAKDLEVQRRLRTIQAGQVTPSEEEALVAELNQGGVSDDIAEDVYEAISKGLLAVFQPTRATILLKSWIAWRPDSVTPRLRLAAIYESMRQHPAARKEFESILSIDPDHRAARLALARNLLKSNEVREALAQFEALAASGPADSEVVLGLAQCHLRLGYPARAKEELLIARQLDVRPDQQASLLFELGQLALSQGKPEEAVSLLQEAVDLAPQESGAVFSLGQALFRVGKRDEAARCMKRAKEVQVVFDRFMTLTDEVASEAPNDLDKRFEVANLLLELQMDREAIGWFHSVLTLRPDHQQTHAALAAYYEKHRDGEKAAYHRHQAGRLAPDEGRVNGTQGSANGTQGPTEGRKDGEPADGAADPGPARVGTAQPNLSDGAGATESPPGEASAEADASSAQVSGSP